MKKNSNSLNKKLSNVWSSMKERCYSESCKWYINYGGRGIKVCDEWVSSIDAFYHWAMSNGYTEGLTLERTDVNKGYSPDNCCWIPKGDQARNKRKYTNNTTGVTGVHKQTLSSGTEVYRAQWSVNKKLHSKAFSIKTHGETKAFEMACAARNEGILKLKEGGIIYGEKHGL